MREAQKTLPATELEKDRRLRELEAEIARLREERESLRSHKNEALLSAIRNIWEGL